MLKNKIGYNWSLAQITDFLTTILLMGSKRIKKSETSFIKLRSTCFARHSASIRSLSHELPTAAHISLLISLHTVFATKSLPTKTNIMSLLLLLGIVIPYHSFINSKRAYTNYNVSKNLKFFGIVTTSMISEIQDLVVQYT